MTKTNKPDQTAAGKPRKTFLCWLGFHKFESFVEADVGNNWIYTLRCNKCFKLKSYWGSP